MKRGLSYKQEAKNLKKSQISYGRMLKEIKSLKESQRNHVTREIKIIESKSSVEIESTGKNKLCLSNL